jgi:dihydrofolate reductase/truncated hemoglobin YjbI
MRLTTTAQVSVDGVMQGPGAPVPGVDEPGGFNRNGWAHFDPEAGSIMDEVFLRADAFLFGRRTYEIFARSWGRWDDPGGSPIWTALHSKPKYVASTSLARPEWAGTTVISSTLEAAVRNLKAQPGRELQVHGSGALFRWLIDHELVDEITLFTFPVVVGRGARLFADSSLGMTLELVDGRSTPGGVTVQVFRPKGRPGYAMTVDLSGPPTVFEAAGGHAGLLRLAEAWHARVLADEVVSHAFSHGFRREHTTRLAAYWTEALGGPRAYSAVFGDETHVVRLHAGQGEHHEMDRRGIENFDRALEDVGLAENPRLRQVLHDYFAWATTTSLARYPDSADEVPPGLQVPRWSWDGRQDPG